MTTAFLEHTLAELQNTVRDQSVQIAMLTEAIKALVGQADTMLSAKDAADLLGKDASTIRRWERMGKIVNYAPEGTPARFKKSELIQKQNRTTHINPLSIL